MLPQPASPFDQIRHEDEQGEWWSARELAPHLGYSGAGAWQNFERVIIEAKSASANQGHDPDLIFSDITKKPSGPGRPSKDYRLNRFACYMIALSADGSKSEVSDAKTYFIVQARRQELDDEEADFFEWRERTIAAYVNAGYSLDWATRRADSIVIRKRLTREWSVRGIEEKEYAILTDRMHMGAFGLTVQMHMGIKDFPVTYRGKRAIYKGDLRPALTSVEMIVIGMGEAVSRELHINRDSQGFPQIARDVDDASALAKETRERIEELTGQPVVSARNMLREPDGGLWQLPAGTDEDA